MTLSTSTHSTSEWAPAPAAPSAGSAATTPLPTPAAAPDLGDMHDWVNHRISTLQKEREGRWQKILGFITGK